MGIKRYKYRAYPTGQQVRMLARTFGSCRVVFNDFLAERDRLYQVGQHKAVSFGETAKQVTTLAKQTPQRAFLAEVSSVALQQAVRDADRAYRNFFDSLTGKRKGQRVGRPRFKRRSSRQTARFTTNAHLVLDTQGAKWGKVRLSKIGDIKFLCSRPLPSVPSSVTVIQESDGTYWVSFVVEEPKPKQAPPTGMVGGIDVGFKDLAALISCNPKTGETRREKINNPRHLKGRLRKLARQQRGLSRKKKGSANWNKARVKVAKTHRKVRDTRLDHHHKLAAKLIGEHDHLGVENLSLAGMGRTRMAKSTYDAGLGTLIQLITEKGENQTRTVTRISRWEPTTQTCSICQTRGRKLSPSIRVWECKNCGSVLDRDYNAAVNIMVAAGLAETLNACGPDIRRALALADGQEAGTHQTDQTHNLAA